MEKIWLYGQTKYTAFKPALKFVYLFIYLFLSLNKNVKGI